MLSYSLKVTMSLMQNRQFRNTVLSVLTKLYMGLKTPDYINVCQVLYEKELGSILGLILYHTIPMFDDPERERFRKCCEKRRKFWFPAFSPFPTILPTKSHRDNYFSKV